MQNGFTFQYGEIKSDVVVVLSVAVVAFTFQYGEIKRKSHHQESIAKKIFTFQYGEIKRVGSGLRVHRLKKIYIPVWRD